jgi:hypothetical protein
MPVRSLAILLLCTTVAACAFNPDPRKRTLEHVVTDGRGGWIAVELTSGTRVEGELIAAGPDAIRVLTSAGLFALAPAGIRSARLWAWDPATEGVILGGSLGTLSTISHGVFLVFSAPLWIVTTTLISTIESRTPITDYPGHGWADFARWARFPQGLPAHLKASDLAHQDRAPVEPAPAPQGPSGGDPR